MRGLLRPPNVNRVARVSAKANIASLEIGSTPCVVGVASRADTLAGLSNARARCDLAEIRLDLIGPAADAWLRTPSEPGRTPRLLTIRGVAEGGQWMDSEGARAKRYEDLMPLVDAVDVELESEAFPRVVESARSAGRAVIGSFHDFFSTPSEARLRELMERGARGGADIVKLAVWTTVEADVARLEALLRLDRPTPLAVMGMGPLGAASRLRLACEGSCLVYGFLDVASAPGQFSSDELVERLTEMLPRYRTLRAR